jgi:hypothetical protein
LSAFRIRAVPTRSYRPNGDGLDVGDTAGLETHAVEKRRVGDKRILKNLEKQKNLSIPALRAAMRVCYIYEDWISREISKMA